MLMESHRRRSRSPEVGLGPTKYILGADSVQCGFYQDTTLQKSGVTLCWLVQGSMVCFSLPDLGRFHIHPQCESMSKRGNKY